MSRCRGYCSKQGHYDKIVSIQEIKSRSGRIIAVVTKGDTQVRELADYVIEILKLQMRCLH
jgi:glucosamine--fructose-6-phosphate aminotransferase (isomerizing)